MNPVQTEDLQLGYTALTSPEEVARRRKETFEVSLAAICIGAFIGLLILNVLHIVDTAVFFASATIIWLFILLRAFRERPEKNKNTVLIKKHLPADVRRSTEDLLWRLIGIIFFIQLFWQEGLLATIFMVIYVFVMFINIRRILQEYRRFVFGPLEASMIPDGMPWQVFLVCIMLLGIIGIVAGTVFLGDWFQHKLNGIAWIVSLYCVLGISLLPSVGRSPKKHEEVALVMEQGE